MPVQMLTTIPRVRIKKEQKLLTSFYYHSEHIQLPQEVERAPPVAFVTHAYMFSEKKRLMTCYRHAFKLTVAPVLTLQIVIGQ